MVAVRWRIFEISVFTLSIAKADKSDNLKLNLEQAAHTLLDFLRALVHYNGSGKLTTLEVHLMGFIWKQLRNRPLMSIVYSLDHIPSCQVPDLKSKGARASDLVQENVQFVSQLLGMEVPLLKDFTLCACTAAQGV